MLQLQLNPFPALESARLLLRQPSMSDAPSLFELRSDEQQMRFVPRHPAKTEQEVNDFISMINDWHQKNQAILWFISLKENQTSVIGTIGLWKFEFESYRAEVGYMLHRAYQSKGFMSEAIHAVLQYGFDQLNLHSVEARVDPENVASIKILDKIGFAREGYLRESLCNKGEFRDNIIFSMLKRHYVPNR